MFLTKVSSNNSRGPSIESPSLSQVTVDLDRRLVPSDRHAHLLPLLEPRGPQVWKFIRTHSMNDVHETESEAHPFASRLDGLDHCYYPVIHERLI